MKMKKRPNNKSDSRLNRINKKIERKLDRLSNVDRTRILVNQVAYLFLILKTERGTDMADIFLEEVRSTLEDFEKAHTYELIDGILRFDNVAWKAYIQDGNKG